MQQLSIYTKYEIPKYKHIQFYSLKQRTASYKMTMVKLVLVGGSCATSIISHHSCLSFKLSTSGKKQALQAPAGLQCLSAFPHFTCSAKQCHSPPPGGATIVETVSLVFKVSKGNIWNISLYSKTAIIMDLTVDPGNTLWNSTFFFLK